LHSCKSCILHEHWFAPKARGTKIAKLVLLNFFRLKVA
jgi:hypothetical protein